MVLAHRERFERAKTQRELAEERFRPGGHPTPMPGPGVFARHNAVDIAGAAARRLGLRAVGQRRSCNDGTSAVTRRTEG